MSLSRGQALGLSWVTGPCWPAAPPFLSLLKLCKIFWWTVKHNHLGTCKHNNELIKELKLDFDTGPTYYTVALCQHEYSSYWIYHKSISAQ